MSIMWLRVPNLPITYFPLNILSVNAVLHKPRSFSEKNGFGTGQVIPSHLFTILNATLLAYVPGICS